MKCASFALKSPELFLMLLTMKNVFKLANGKWRFEIVENGKTFCKTFSSKTDALDYAKNWFDARKFELSFFLNLPKERIKDIKDAIEILPEGKSLLESVKKAWRYFSDADLLQLADEYFNIKKTKHLAGKLSKDEFVHIKGRVESFKKTFKTFADLSPEALKNFLLAKGSTKTVSLWKGTVSELLEFCISRGALPHNPVKFIHSDELIKPEKEKSIGFLSPGQTKSFMAHLETEYPQYCRFYAIALFAGIRIAEIPRMKDEYFRFDERKIVFPAQIGKVKKAWILEDLPQNLWAWLEKYKNFPIKRPSNVLRTNLGKLFTLPENFARHSFATYHLSLFFDFAKTSRITRNSEQMLKDHYMAALVPKDLAKEYFEILPASY